MSWHFLQGQEVHSWEGSLDGAPSALLSLLPTLEESSLPGSETDSSGGSQSGMTSAHSTGDPGEVQSTSLAEDSRASTGPRLPEGGLSLQTCGPKCLGWCARSGPDSSSRRMSSGSPYVVPLQILRVWATEFRLPKSQPPQWARRMFANDGGYVATPTRKGNQWAPSMRKWPGCRNLQDLFGPDQRATAFEYLMGWPIGWTALEPLVTDRFQQWLRSHGGYLEAD